MRQRALHHDESLRHRERLALSQLAVPTRALDGFSGAAKVAQHADVVRREVSPKHVATGPRSFEARDDEIERASVVARQVAEAGLAIQAHPLPARVFVGIRRKLFEQMFDT